MKHLKICTPTQQRHPCRPMVGQPSMIQSTKNELMTNSF